MKPVLDVSSASRETLFLGDVWEKQIQVLVSGFHHEL